MAKQKNGWLIFTICVLLFSVLFLVATAVGLNFLWGYMESYERSRPKHAVEAYMQQLTPEYICDKSTDLFDKVDASVQSDADCRRVITEALSEKFTCVKNLGESTEEKTVYLVRCGSRIIGRFTIAPSEELEHGFSAWKAVSDSFDLSFLLTPGHTVTIPETYSVIVNGVTLNDTHIYEPGIRFPLLAAFYEDYTLPTLVTYKTGTTLGATEMVITDPSGMLVSIDESTSYDDLLPRCSEAVEATLDSITSDFIQDYVDFTSCTNNDIYGNYDRLKDNIVPNGPLAKRMKDAIAGLKWVSDRGAKVAGIDILHRVDIGGGKYLCDIVYRVNTRNITGSIQTESHVMIIFTATGDGLKAETMLTC